MSHLILRNCCYFFSSFLFWLSYFNTLVPLLPISPHTTTHHCLRRHLHKCCSPHLLILTAFSLAENVRLRFFSIFLIIRQIDHLVVCSCNEWQLSSPLPFFLCIDDDDNAWVATWFCHLPCPLSFCQCQWGKFTAVSSFPFLLNNFIIIIIVFSSIAAALDLIFVFSFLSYTGIYFNGIFSFLICILFINFYQYIYFFSLYLL